MDILVAILSSSVLSTLITQIFAYLQRKQDKASGLNKGMRLMLKDRLRFLCVHYIQQGWIYADELEDLLSMHECYHTDLGGNGYLDELIKDVKALPIHGLGVH